MTYTEKLYIFSWVPEGEYYAETEILRGKSLTSLYSTYQRSLDHRTNFDELVIESESPITVKGTLSLNEFIDSLFEFYDEDEEDFTSKCFLWKALALASYTNEQIEELFDEHTAKELIKYNAIRLESTK